MQRIFRENNQFAVSKQNPLLLRPTVSPAMLLWMPQIAGTSRKAISSEQILSRPAAVAIVVVGVVLAMALHGASRLANVAHSISSQRSYDSTRRQINQEMSFRLLPVISDVDFPAMLGGTHKSAESGRRQVTHGLQRDFPAELKGPIAMATLDEVQSADRARREIAGEILSSLVSGEQKFAAAVASPTVYGSADGERRQITQGMLPVVSHVMSEPSSAKELKGPLEIWDRIRRQIETLLRLLPNLSENHLAKAEVPHESYDRLRRQTALPAVPVLTVNEAAITPKTYDGAITATTSASAQKHALNTPFDIQPTPKPKPKRLARTKRVSSKKTNGRCWNRIWRC
jgi:hypothetical protein